MDRSTAEHLKHYLVRLQSDVSQLVVPRHCSGTVPLEEGKAGLCFRKDDKAGAGWIDFASPNGVDDTSLEDLVSACAPAKFGRGNQDVLDESYRKAWKLDASRFAMQFDLAESGILGTVHDALLQYADSTSRLEAHLDKLNVYGPGSFFKAHVDTPRHPNMLATLVIVLPTEHEGGDLLLLGKPWLFDSAKLVSKNQSNGTPRLAFIAFYSDIEHEVTPVISGYRVTVTYNLYCQQPLDPVGPRVLLRPTPEENAIRDTLRALLSNDELMPYGGLVGFGLTYKYPVSIEGMEQVSSIFEGRLKGSDALIERACKALGFTVQVKALYRYGEVSENTDDFLSYCRDGNAWVIDTTDLNGVDSNFDYEESGSEWARWLKSQGSQLKPFDYQGKKKHERPIIWITRPAPMSLSKIAYLAYGNEASVEWIYGTLALIAQVPSYPKRRRMFNGEPTPSDVDDDNDDLLSGSSGSDGAGSD